MSGRVRTLRVGQGGEALATTLGYLGRIRTGNGAGVSFGGQFDVTANSSGSSSSSERRLGKRHLPCCVGKQDLKRAKQRAKQRHQVSEGYGQPAVGVALRRKSADPVKRARPASQPASGGGGGS